jgi:hypothetical protein
VLRSKAPRFDTSCIVTISRGYTSLWTPFIVEIVMFKSSNDSFSSFELLLWCSEWHF